LAADVCLVDRPRCDKCPLKRQCVASESKTA
jgi:adenine-specific DNA glycosylase